MRHHIDAIKSSIHVNDYASRYLDIKQGVALCPFHVERTPSLRLHREYFFCFGCGAGGDVIKFAARYHELSNGDAIRLLAAESGISLTPPPKLKPYDRAKEERIAAEAEEWRNQVRKRAKNWPAADLLRAMSRRELVDEYKGHRTKDLGEEMRAIMRDTEQWVKAITPLVQASLNA